jgi:hypothetical protein
MILSVIGTTLASGVVLVEIAGASGVEVDVVTEAGLSGANSLLGSALRLRLRWSGPSSSLLKRRTSAYSFELAPPGGDLRAGCFGASRHRESYPGLGVRGGRRYQRVADVRMEAMIGLSLLC